ncbi:MAG TPA: rod shape-determining protein MreC [Candidatus Hydrogenedentes bacterium]|nr:rod shape-determining protein MreC [Candidatus Hydrogenedentota bacterium]
MIFSRFIREHRPAVVFAVLMFLSFVSLVTGTESSFIQNGVKKAVEITAFPFLKAKSITGQAIGYVTGLVVDYDAMHKENAALKADVVKLKIAASKRLELQAENQRLRTMLKFTREQPGFSLEPVKVLESYKGMLRIDRGSVNGVTTSMAVVTADGVVGIVTEVSAFTSIVTTLHHPSCKIGAMVQRNRLRAYDGVIHSSGSDLNRLCTMDYIDMKNEVRVGDPVVTSPESLFPAGYPIGVVSAPPHESGSLWKTAEITPAVDPYRLDEVFLIRQAQPGAEELAGPPPSPKEDMQTASPPDTSPIQERYAP